MKEKNESASYFMIIPATVWSDPDLTKTQQILYGHISVLTSQEGYCFASNDYFAKQLGVSKKTISVGISALSEKGYIVTKVFYKETGNVNENTGEANVQVDHRKIWLVEPYVIAAKRANKKATKSSSVNSPINENVNSPINENVINNSIKNNNIKINNINVTSKDLQKRFFVKGTTECDLFFKLQHKYPVNKRGAKLAVAKALSTLTLDQMNEAVANVERYVSLYQNREKYIVMLYNYIENGCYTNEWLEAEERINQINPRENSKDISSSIKRIKEMIKENNEKIKA